MNKCCTFLAALYVIINLPEQNVADVECRSIGNPGRTLNLAINSKKNETGEWVTEISATKDLTFSSKNISLDLTHQILECDGKQMIHVKGIIKDAGNTKEPLLFHHRCGKNVAIIEKGLTVKKLNFDEAFNAVTFTNRPLQNNELFEVKLEEKNRKFGYSLGIGVTAHSPNEIEIPPEMYYMPKAWMMHHNGVYENRKRVFQGYSVDLNNLKVGDRVGVMRSEFGTLHFFVNGLDLGPSASNIPYPVYGVFELWQDAVKGSIINAS